MENARVICETDAEVLLDFKQMKDSGFAFTYSKKENGISQEYVNCNGKIFGPYDSVCITFCSDDTARWTAEKGDLEFHFDKNGKECKTEKKSKRNEVLSQEEIDQLLTAISGTEEYDKDTEYDERTHILRINSKHQEFFIAGQKKYGPYYSINTPEYKNEDCFQFICRKRQYSKNWYYNLNGKEIGPFHGNHYGYRYDEQNRAILDYLSDYNFILIDGKKVKCFSQKYHHCRICEGNGHKIIIGEDADRQTHFERDGILQDFIVRNIYDMSNGDVVYSKIHVETETWFYNDKQISITVNGHDSWIYESLISYKRENIPYFTLKNTEYNGMEINDFDEGFVFLDNNRICFFPWVVPNFHRIADGTMSGESYSRYREGNYLSLYNTNRLAGRD